MFAGKPTERSVLGNWRVAITLIVATTIGPVNAEDAPANTLRDLRRQIVACLAPPAADAGSQITVLFSVRRDGSLLGKPRITHSDLLGGPEMQRAFLAETIQALTKCLPLRVTDELGAAIAGRLFSIRIGKGPRETAI